MNHETGWSIIDSRGKIAGNRFIEPDGTVSESGVLGIYYARKLAKTLMWPDDKNVVKVGVFIIKRGATE